MCLCVSSGCWMIIGIPAWPPDASIKQIADMLGFQYPQHFQRFFKKEVGCTPKEYRINS